MHLYGSKLWKQIRQYEKNRKTNYFKCYEFIMMKNQR